MSKNIFTRHKILLLEKREIQISFLFVVFFYHKTWLNRCDNHETLYTPLLLALNETDPPKKILPQDYGNKDFSLRIVLLQSYREN